MKRKPTSHIDLLKTVARVKHPELEDVHKLWLLGLALHASATGGSAYPGYEALSEITDRKYDRQRLYSNHCCKLGLVEIVKKGNGPHVANVYRFCLEHPAYPDDYKGRKDDDPASVGKRDDEPDVPLTRLAREAGSNGDPTSQAGLSRSSDARIPLVSSSNPLGEGSDYQLLHQKQHQQHHHSVTTWRQHPRVKVVKKAIAAIDDAFEKSEGSPPKRTEQHKAGMAAIVLAYGGTLTELVWAKYLEDRDTKLTWPYKEFIDCFEQHLHRAERSDRYRNQIWQIRKAMYFAGLPGLGYGFEKTWTPEEQAAVEERHVYLKSNRENDPQEVTAKMPLHFVGAILDLQRRGKAWVEQNKEVIDRMDRENEEAVEEEHADA